MFVAIHKLPVWLLPTDRPKIHSQRQDYAGIPQPDE